MELSSVICRLDFQKDDRRQNHKHRNMDTLNLVVLGMPSSGKSTLLGALQRSANKKGTKLDGDLVDLTGELKKLAAGDRVEPTKDAVVAYPLKRRVDGLEENVTIVDTGGKAAADVLAGAEFDVHDPVPRALADADSVILAIDASTPPNDLKLQFRQTVRFLEAWQTRRSTAATVGGLPVFLVLTKCDLVARPDEDAVQWARNLDNLKKRVAELFDRELDNAAMSFGRIDVRVHTTAVRRPNADEPYQVDELFRDVFAGADAYRRRTEKSSQTLQGSLVGLGGFAVLMALLLGWYFATQPTLDEVALESRAQALVAGSDENVAERVREPLDDRLRELREVRQNPLYEELPAVTRRKIEATESAIEEYRRLNEEYQKEVRNPRLATREADLDAIAKSLAAMDAKVAVWPDTRLAKRHQEWLDETRALRQALAEEEAWTREQIDRGEALRTQGFKLLGASATSAEMEPWFKAIHEYQIRGRRHKLTDRVPETTIPYRVVYQFDTLTASERRWRETKMKLDQLRDEARAK